MPIRRLPRELKEEHWLPNDDNDYHLSYTSFSLKGEYYEWVPSYINPPECVDQLEYVVVDAPMDGAETKQRDMKLYLRKLGWIYATSSRPNCLKLVVLSGGFTESNYEDILKLF